MPQKVRNPEDFIEPLNLGGMRGRMLRLPAPAKYENREILFIYGQHASLERMWGLMEVLNRYGAVTMPDLPGFGGMDSLYSVGSKPTIDNLADYLATFIRWRYKRKKVAIAALSFGFIVVTRMLQRYPELAKKITLLISAEGFSHYQDFRFSPGRFRFYKYGSAFFASSVPAWFFQNVFLQPAWLKLAYRHSFNAKSKFIGKPKEVIKELMKVEIGLWTANDIRTQMQSSREMLRLDNCTERVDLPLYHIFVKADQYLDHYLVEQHLGVIYREVKAFEAKLDNHSISVIADAKSASKLIPAGVKRILRDWPS